MVEKFNSYAETATHFRWAVPAAYNIGVDVCDKWADGSGRLALIHESASGQVTWHTFDALRSASNRLANAWRAAGLAPGDRVGIFLPQSPQAALAHLAAYKSGAIAVPLFYLFGTDALQFRLADSGTRFLVTDAAGLGKVRQIRDTLPALQTLYCTEGEGNAFDAALAAHPEAFEPVATRADDPALIIYTSGTTGKPKGALHAHRVLLGHLPGVEMSHDFLPQPGDLIWTPADWAWIGGLLDVLLPAWHHGVPVLARRLEKFDPAEVFALIRRHGVRNMFLPPTALKMLRAAGPPAGYQAAVRSIASGGEALGAELLQWGRDVFGVTINEFYGQTECNMVVSSCAALFPPVPGALGKAAFGHHVAVVDDTGQPVPAGVTGQIAIRRPDPVMMLEYWHDPVATREKFLGEYLVTGDMGRIDDAGFIRFLGRNDDVITSAGYRIGPGPIEDCLLRHPAVALAAVVGQPDATRTEIVKAFIVLNPGYAPAPELVAEIQAFVREHLSAHEYPRAVAFVDALPMTVTGKIIRKALRALSGD